MIIKSTDTVPPTYEFIIRKLLPSGRLMILDLGCETGVWGATLNRKKKYEFTGVDIYKPYLDICRKKGYYKRLIKDDLTNIDFKTKSFDVVFLFQVIEHLGKEDAIKLIKKSINIARKAVIISVPNGECHQGVYDCNEHQKHLSKWMVEDLEKLGFRVFGQGLRVIYGSESYERSKKASLWQKIVVPLSSFLFPLVLFFPQLGAQLIAVKYDK